MKSDWQVKKLSDIVEFNPTERLSKGAIAKKIPMDMLQPFTKDIFQYELQPYTGGAKFRNGDTIMARITPCLENGKVSKVNILTKDEVGFGSTEYIVLRAIPDVSDPDFIYYLTISDLVRAPAIKSMVGSSGRQRVQQNVLETLELPIPPYDEQKKIAAILSALDEKIAINREINDNLLEQINCLCSEWIEHDIVPEGWSEFALSDIADFVGGYSYKSSELVESTTAMATIKNFDRNGGFKLDGFKELQPSPKIKSSQFVELFDILVAHTDLTQNAEVVGNAELIMSKSNYDRIAFSMDLVKVVPTVEGLSNFLLGAILQTKRFKAHCLGYVNGTTVLHLSKKALPEYRLLLPNDLSYLKPLDEAITFMYKEISANVAENLKLELIRDSVLPKLMSGDLDVSEVRI